jgi:hypothetical protein
VLLLLVVLRSHVLGCPLNQLLHVPVTRGQLLQRQAVLLMRGGDVVVRWRAGTPSKSGCCRHPPTPHRTASQHTSRPTTHLPRELLLLAVHVGCHSPHESLDAQAGHITWCWCVEVGRLVEGCVEVTVRGLHAAQGSAASLIKTGVALPTCCPTSCCLCCIRQAHCVGAVCRSAVPLAQLNMGQGSVGVGGDAGTVEANAQAVVLHRLCCIAGPVCCVCGVVQTMVVVG